MLFIRTWDQLPLHQLHGLRASPPNRHVIRYLEPRLAITGVDAHKYERAWALSSPRVTLFKIELW
jgi:hypothetical protein